VPHPRWVCEGAVVDFRTLQPERISVLADNMTADGTHTYAWDADGNSITMDSVAVTYDALDRAVEQNRSGSYTEIVYAHSGGKLALMNGQTLLTAFVPLPGQATAVYTASGLDHYRRSDWLGSARLTSSPSQTYLSSTAYTPFGGTYASSGTPDPSFTGQNSDTVSTDYDFLFRTFSTTGRWPSPDPAGVSATCPKNPQTQNRYTYVENNPLSYVDPLGTQSRPCFFGPCSGNGGGGGTCDPVIDPFCGCPPRINPTVSSAVPSGVPASATQQLIRSAAQALEVAAVVAVEGATQILRSRAPSPGLYCCPTSSTRLLETLAAASSGAAPVIMRSQNSQASAHILASLR
jgi:RHS repeat-associated protein